MAFAGGGSRRSKYARRISHRMAQSRGEGGTRYLSSTMIGKVRDTIAKMKTCRASSAEVAKAGYNVGLIPSPKLAQKVRQSYSRALTAWRSCAVR